MLDSYVCNHSLLGADFGQSAIRCARNKVGEKAWSISYIYRNIQLSLLKTGRKPSALHSLLACFLLELVQAFPGTMNSSATKKLVHLKAGKILSFRSTCAQHLYLRNACKSRVLPGKKGHLTVRAEQGKNGTAAVLFRGETVHRNGAELEAEWGTLSDYFTMPLSQWDTGRMKY